MSTGYTGGSALTGTPWPGLERSASESSWCLVTDEEAEPSQQQPVLPVAEAAHWEPGQVPSLALHPAEKRLLLGTIFLADFDKFDFPGLACLYSHSSLLEFPQSPKQRIHRAARAGVSARDKLDGVVGATVSSQKLPRAGETTWYVCLRCRAAPSGFLTKSYPIYAAKVIDRRGKFELGSVSHSFSCLVEIAAYLAGASAQWPVELHH